MNFEARPRACSAANNPVSRPRTSRRISAGTGSRCAAARSGRVQPTTRFQDRSPRRRGTRRGRHAPARGRHHRPAERTLWRPSPRVTSDLASRSTADRRLFGARLGDLGMRRQMIAVNEIDIATDELSSGLPAGTRSGRSRQAGDGPSRTIGGDRLGACFTTTRGPFTRGASPPAAGCSAMSRDVSGRSGFR